LKPGNDEIDINAMSKSSWSNRRHNRMQFQKHRKKFNKRIKQLINSF